MTSEHVQWDVAKQTVVFFRETAAVAPYIVSEALPSWLHFLYLYCFKLFFFLILPNSPGEPNTFSFSSSFICSFFSLFMGAAY
jgi:hypothetical protein